MVMFLESLSTYWKTTLGLALLFPYVLYRFRQFRSAGKDFGGLPTYTCLISPMSLVGSTLPYYKWNPSRNFTWRERSTLYSTRHIDAFVIRPILIGVPAVYLGSTDSIKQVLGDIQTYAKPDVARTIVDHQGQNVVSSQGDDWKRHRRIVAPAFNSTTYANVWDTTVATYKKILDKDRWPENGEMEMPAIEHYTRKMAMFIVAGCSFGIPMQWEEPDIDEKGRYSAQHIIASVAKYMLFRGLAPTSLFKFPLPIIKHVDRVYTEFGSMASDLIVQREKTLQQRTATDEGEGIQDILGRLVHSRLVEGKFSMSNSEIIGNCFILLFAGHETTAHVLAATISLLGIHLDVQDRIHNQIRDILGEREPAYEDYDSLFCVLACFYEALRLYPAVYSMVRQTTNDAVLHIPDRLQPSKQHAIPLPKESLVVLDFVGALRHAHIDAASRSFDPAKWTPAMEHVGFSAGPRVCLGKKFALVEAVAFLTCVLKDWHIEAPVLPSETPEGAEARLFRPELGFTTQLHNIPLKMTRRSS